MKLYTLIITSCLYIFLITSITLFINFYQYYKHDSFISFNDAFPWHSVYLMNSPELTKKTHKISPALPL